MFNRREQIALLFLGVSLIAGSGVALVDHYRPEAAAEFQIIPRAVEAPAPVEAGPVRLNAATAAQLERLPGIGPRTAAAILRHRQERGPFKKVEELERVPGIGGRTIEKLRGLVVID